MATFGILVGGGPAPGINGVIGAATATALEAGHRVIGILDAPPADTTVMEVGGDPSDELFIDPNDPILKTRKKRRARSITKEWWFWTAIGGTAAALTVGAIVLFSQQDEGKGPVGDLVINFNKVGGD